jgi:prevent-host-death family protein
MDEQPTRPVAVVTASELAREGARVRQLTGSGWVLVTRRGKPAGAMVAPNLVRDLVDWSDPGGFVSARDLSRTGAVSDMLDAVESGDVRVLTEHNRPIAALVSAAPFVEQLRRAFDASAGSEAGGGTFTFVKDVPGVFGGEHKAPWASGQLGWGPETPGPEVPA